jgi:amphi-Trp domain-containing protein
MELDMKNDNNQFRHESLQDRETIADLLSSLQQGLTSGTLKFGDDENKITLKPSGLLNLTITASASGELNMVDVRIAWQSNEPNKIKKELFVSTD